MSNSKGERLARIFVLFEKSDNTYLNTVLTGPIFLLGAFVVGVTILVGVPLTLARTVIVGTTLSLVSPSIALEWLKRFSWQELVRGLVSGFGIMVFGGFAHSIFYLAHLANLKRARSLARTYPRECALLARGLDRSTQVVISTTLIGLGGFSVIAGRSGILDDFSFLLILLSGHIAAIYGVTLFRYRNLGVWAIYEIRKLVIPYVIASVPAFLAAFYFGWWIYYFYLHDIVGLDELIRALAPGFKGQVVQGWNIAPAVVLEAAVSSIAIGVLLAWVLPSFVKKDYVGLSLTLLVLAGPFVMSHVKFAEEVIMSRMRPIFGHIPQAVQAAAAVLAVNYLYDRLKLRLRFTVVCGECALRIRVTDRYCPNCGSRNQKADE